MLEFEMDEQFGGGEEIARLLVVGVGGGGGNAVERMLESGMEGADFLLVNTDKQVLYRGKAESKLLIGEQLTKGRGAGGRAEVGRQAAEESEEAIRNAVRGYDMVFVTAGMGGGTGTGAAPIVARVAHDLGILTVGVVTKPFTFEGARKMRLANAGVDELAKNVDSLITISNDRLLGISDPKTTMIEAFSMADSVLQEGVQGISDLIYRPGIINLDFADVTTVMEGHGNAHMGIGIASGDGRARKAAEMAISSPLLETTIDGARALLVNVCGSADMGIFEYNEVLEHITSRVDEEALIIIGSSVDETLGESIKVTVIATDFVGEIPHYTAPAAVKEDKEQEPVRPADSTPIKLDDEEIDEEPIPVKVDVPLPQKVEPVPDDEEEKKDVLDIPLFLQRKKRK